MGNFILLTWEKHVINVECIAIRKEIYADSNMPEIVKS